MLHPCRSSPGHWEVFCKDSRCGVWCPASSCVQMMGVAGESKRCVNTATRVKHRGTELECPVVVRRQLCPWAREVMLSDTDEPDNFCP